MNLSKILTIVIPCKNEMLVIDKTLTLLNYQIGIEDVKVIVADSSDDGTTYMLESRNKDYFDLEIVQGGLPGVARNYGASKVTTPYVLFIDADMFILDNDLLMDVIKIMRINKYDLLTTKVRTDNGEYNFIFRTFDIIQKLIKPITPFSLGGFMLFNVKTFRELNGFDELAKVAEDYLLSKQIKSGKFKILNKTIFTSPRRFKNKGVWYMLMLMIKSFFHRNNKKFFSNHKTYWK